MTRPKPKVWCSECFQPGGHHKLDCSERGRADVMLWHLRGGHRVAEIEEYIDVWSPDGEHHVYASVIVHSGAGEVLRANVPTSDLVIMPLRPLFWK